jgi:hypothetical protein
MVCGALGHLTFPGPKNSEEQTRSKIQLLSWWTAAIRITGFSQRLGTNLIDVAGKIYVAGGVLTLDAAFWSKDGLSGPWYNATILTSDPAYSWPGTGTPSGLPFNAPIEVVPIGTGSFPIWIQLYMTA